MTWSPALQIMTGSHTRAPLARGTRPGNPILLQALHKLARAARHPTVVGWLGSELEKTFLILHMWGFE